MIVDNVLNRIFVKVVLALLDESEPAVVLEAASLERPWKVVRLAKRGGFTEVELGQLRGKQLIAHVYALAPGDDLEPFARGADACLLIMGEPANAAECASRMVLAADPIIVRSYDERGSIAPSLAPAIEAQGPFREHVWESVSVLLKHYLVYAKTETIRVTELNTLEEVVAAFTVNTH